MRAGSLDKTGYNALCCNKQQYSISQHHFMVKLNALNRRNKKVENAYNLC